ncbi:MAG TPA: response regulator transcription factor [Nitrospira sp.]|nr:response regulator transcription factor [Nitrospira sp.]
MIRIVIADDHAVVRRGLKEILADESDMEIGAEASTAHELLDLVRKHPWDAVVLDISLPGRSGLEVLAELKQEQPTLPVLVHTMHPEDQFAVRALRAGAAGYLTKDSAPTELVKALRKIVAGGKYVSASLAEKLAASMDVKAVEVPHQILSDREFEVFRLIASGTTVSEIAEQLSLSVKTVSTYRGRILEKMKMKNNADLMRYALQQKVVE